MSTPVSGRQAEIVRLTKAAGEAAQQGRWDQVIQCYSERGLLLAAISDSGLPIDELLRMDEELRDRIHTAQTLLEHLLAEAQTTKLMALNQGYYNLFLAIATVAGIYLWNTGYVSQAVAILTVTLGSMVAAALVLLFSAGIAMLRGVLLQGLVPAITLALIWRPV